MQLQTSLGRRGSDGNLMSSGKSGDGAGDTNETRDIARVMATHYKQLGGVWGLRATKLTHFKGNSEDRDPNSSFFFLFSQASVTTGETRNNYPAATSVKPEYRPAVAADNYKSQEHQDNRNYDQHKINNNQKLQPQLPCNYER